MGMDTSVRVARGMARGRKGHGPWGPIGDADSRSTSGPDPAAEDVRIVTGAGYPTRTQVTLFRLYTPVVRKVVFVLDE